VVPKFVSPSDPAAQWTGAMRGPAFFAYADNYLIDVKFGIIMDVKASRAIRQAEVGAAKTMIERTEERFDIKPTYLAADTAYGSADTLNWIVNEKKIAPHIPVIDKSKREDVACDGNGVAEFERLRRQKRIGQHVFLYAFDLLELDGSDLRGEPFEVRKATLASLLRGCPPGVRLNEPPFQVAFGEYRQNTDPPHSLARLRPCRQRPRRRAAEQRHELPPSHAGHGRSSLRDYRSISLPPGPPVGPWAKPELF
jgi:hypothetical protein